MIQQVVGPTPGMTSDSSFQQTPQEVGHAEGAQSETRVVASHVDLAGEEQAGVGSPVSSESLGSPPLLAVSPPGLDLTELPQNEQEHRLCDTGEGHYFNECDDLENCRGPEAACSGGYSRTSGSCPGKSRSPSRSPRRHSPTPYSPSRQHRSYSGSSTILEDLTDVSLSPRRRSSASFSPQRLRSHSNGSLTSDEYLEVTVPSPRPGEVTYQAAAEVVFSTALSLDSDPGDVEMLPDEADCPPASDRSRSDSEVSSPGGWGTVGGMSPPHGQGCEDLADPDAVHSFDVALLTDDSSDDDFSSSGSDKENIMDDTLVAQSSDNETRFCAKIQFTSQDQSSSADQKGVCFCPSEDLTHSKADGRRIGCVVLQSSGGGVPVQPPNSSSPEVSDVFGIQPDTGHAERSSGIAFLEGKAKAPTPNSPLDQTSVNTFGDASPSQTAAVETSTSSLYSLHSELETCSPPCCTCGRAMNSPPHARSPPSPSLFQFPHCLDAVLLHPSQHNPYNPQLPTPPIVLTPFTSYSGLSHCYPDFAEDRTVSPDGRRRHRSGGSSSGDPSGQDSEGKQGRQGGMGAKAPCPRCNRPTSVDHRQYEHSWQQHSVAHQHMDHSGHGGWEWPHHHYDSSWQCVLSERQQTTDLGNSYPSGSTPTAPSSTSSTEENSGGGNRSKVDLAHGSSGSGSSGKAASPRAALIGKLRQVVERRLSSSEDPGDTG